MTARTKTKPNARPKATPRKKAAARDWTAAFRVGPGRKIRLSAWNPAEDGGFDKKETRKATAKIIEEIDDLQCRLYAESKQALLVVLQAIDAGGKDGTIRRVFGPINPQGMRVTSFKKPTELERSHDFLWRIHRAVPPLGHIGLFNRSHYEDVLVVRVRKLAPPEIWKARYDHINAFERMLRDHGTRVVKFFLYISRDEQRDRMQRRLDDPGRNWKFSEADLEERKHWDDYMAAFEDALSRCSTADAPWYVVPANRKWFRDHLVATVLRDTLRAMDPRTPPSPDLSGIVIDG